MTVLVLTEVLLLRGAEWPLDLKNILNFLHHQYQDLCENTQMLFFAGAFALAYSAQFVFLLVLVELLHCNEYLAQFLGLFIYGAVNFSCNKFLTFR